MYVCVCVPLCACLCVCFCVDLLLHMYLDCCASLGCVCWGHSQYSFCGSSFSGMQAEVLLLCPLFHGRTSPANYQNVWGKLTLFLVTVHSSALTSWTLHSFFNSSIPCAVLDLYSSFDVFSLFFFFLPVSSFLLYDIIGDVRITWYRLLWKHRLFNSLNFGHWQGLKNLLIALWRKKCAVGQPFLQNGRITQDSYLVCFIICLLSLLSLSLSLFVSVCLFYFYIPSIPAFSIRL